MTSRLSYMSSPESDGEFCDSLIDPTTLGSRTLGRGSSSKTEPKLNGVNVEGAAAVKVSASGKEEDLSNGDPLSVAAAAAARMARSSSDPSLAMQEGIIGDPNTNMHQPVNQQKVSKRNYN